MKATRRTKPAQLPLPLKGPHGGRRKGAGRKNRSGRQGHARRAKLSSRVPVHVTLKLVPALPSLRRKDVFRMLRGAVKTARKRGFGVAHFAILSNHVHLILEPKESGLSAQIQSLCISFARRLNHALHRSGAVFHDRYHAHALRTPAEVRSALAYVLTNEALHSRRRHARASLEVVLGPFSSALEFENWRALVGSGVRFRPSLWGDDSVELWFQEILAPPRTWLLTRGWMRRKGNACEVQSPVK